MNVQERDLSILEHILTYCDQKDIPELRQYCSNLLASKQSE